MQHTHLQEIINAELAEAAAICRAVLSEPEMAGFASCLPKAPADAQGWFQLLSKYPGAQEIIAIQRMKDVVNPDGAAGFPSVERYAVLQALTVALPRVKDLALAVPVKRKFAKTGSAGGPPQRAVAAKLRGRPRPVYTTDGGAGDAAAVSCGRTHFQF